MKEQNWKGSISAFLGAQTISLFGSSLVQYAIVWYITLSTSSGKMLTISTLCGFLPQILISLFAGLWIDRYDRKKIIIFSDGVIALSTLSLSIAFITGHRNIWFLFGVLIVRSFGTGIQTPCVNATIPQIVPREHLMKVNGINSTLSSLMMFLSPAISGSILSVFSLEVTLLIDVATAIIGISITFMVYIKPYAKKEITQSSGLIQLLSGFKYLRQNLFVKRLIMMQLAILFLISPSAFLTPLMVSRTFGPEVWRLTVSEMTYSLGMVLGGVFITYRGGFKNKLHTTLLSGGFYGLLMIGLGTASYFPLYLAFNTMIGLTSPCYNAPITVTIQETVEPEMQGRVFGFMQIASSCALPLGMVFFGPLSDLIPVQYILIFCGLVVCLSIFMICKTQFITKNFKDFESTIHSLNR